MMEDIYFPELGMSEKELMKKLPFTKATNGATGKTLDFSWYGRIPKGWRIAFGKEMLTEMAAEYKNFTRHDRKEWRVTGVMEKYGELRIYTGMTTPGMDDILEKYTSLSHKRCLECGKPCVQRGDGWIYTMCEDCYEDMVERLGHGAGIRTPFD
ncbi:MAG: hypothetical protein J5582_10720 [Ruminococcus sp.]|uniref:Uncharacterized protein n=2 Tax=Ruminococcus albus TaxID=1264 RepID=A0A1H7K8W3_RUMAL|nr:hypothetical protein [Ruminococcus sp.]MBO4867013.1 hypothetical protein [Ruminococcus sp.]SEK83259.1 hypothetical protein SAMN05216469_106117 [Ruminococcus albus]